MHQVSLLVYRADVQYPVITQTTIIVLDGAEVIADSPLRDQHVGTARLKSNRGLGVLASVRNAAVMHIATAKAGPPSNGRATKNTLFTIQGIIGTLGSGPEERAPLLLWI